MPEAKPSLPVVYLTVFLDLLGFGIILPLLPYYAKEYGATGVTLGVLMTAYSAAQFVGAPVIGRLSDRFGRRPVLLLTLLGSSLSLALAGLADSLALLIAARTLAGLFGGSIAAAQAYIADVTKPEERAKYMGILGACIGMGFVFGPATGAALSSYGFGTAAFVASGLTFLNFLWAVVRLPESRKAGTATRFSVGVVAHALGRPALRPILGATFLATLGFVGMETTYALLGAQLYELTPKGLGFVFTFLGVVIALVQGGMIGRLVKKHGEARIAQTGVVLLGIALAAVPFAPTLAFSVAALGVVAVGQGLASPTLSTLLSRRAAVDEQGGALGLGQSLAAAARAIGPLLAGWLYDRAIPAPYLTAGALCLGAAALVGQLERSPADPQPQESQA